MKAEHGGLKEMVPTFGVISHQTVRGPQNVEFKYRYQEVGKNLGSLV